MAVRKFLDDSGAAQLNTILTTKFNEKQDNMVILSYGHSTWQDFLDAYNKNGVVYCRASSASDPGSGSQTRLAFMAYVNNAENPTNVEFQYYRSVNSHTVSQQEDQVFVYKLTSSGSWTVTVREAGAKIVAGTNMSSSYSNDVLTLSATDTTYESKTAASGGTDVSLVTTGEKEIWNNKGNYNKPSSGIPKTDLSSEVQTSLGKADTALQSETYTGTITGITMNGTSKGTSGNVDLGTVITEHQDISGKQNQVTYDTTDIIAGTTALPTGDIYIVYE